MRKIIIGTEDCAKCKMLAMSNPDAELIKLPQDVILAFAKETNIRSLPILVLSGEQSELSKAMKGMEDEVHNE